jgi:methyl-accepting chemotaxis protein
MKRQQRITAELENSNNKEVIINKLPDDGTRDKNKSGIIHFFRSIRVKLMISFFVPIIFIIILGVSAYSSASKAIISNFTDTTISMIQSSGNYYSVVMQVIEGKMLDLCDDNDMKQYYSGSNEGKSEEVQYLLNIKKKFSDMSLSDSYIKNLGIIADYGSAVSSKGVFGDKNLYNQFSTTEEAATLDSSYDVIWTGYHNFLDEQLKIDSEDYAISISNKFVNKYGDQIGFLQMDLRMNVVVDTLKSMELPKDSIVSFISPDGREITSAGTSKEAIFSNQPFYNKAIKGKETSGKKTVDYNGVKHLFIYSKIGDTGAVVAALVPSASLMNQASAIKYQTAIIVFIAAIIAGIIGVKVSSGIGAVIKKIIGVLAKASSGDLTVSVKTNRKDEFLILSDSINHMISNMKKLITKASGVGNTVITSTDYVAQNSELLLSAAQDISTAIQNIQQGIIQQASDTEQCLRQTDELANQIHLVHDNSHAIEHR